MKRFIIFLSLFIVLQSQLVSLEHSSKFRNWYNTNYITDIMSVDNKFAIGSSRGFILFTPQNGEFVILNKSDGIIDNQINGLVSDSDNLFLFTPSGITVLSVDTTRIRNISTSFSGIEGEPSIGLLKGDTVFLGTTEYLYIWDTEGDPYNPFNMSWTNNPYTFRNYGINALFFEDDTLYVGTNGGLCMVPDYSFTDTTQWIWNSVGEGLPDSIVTDVASWEGELWIGTEDGIVSGSMNNWILRNSGLYSREVNRLFSDDTLWAAT
ncbi:hypothetical protein KAU34_01920, partial [candidate division WOR-3 bacterium]|nr:hypothetical protein [candidate division WOR-3 bacterium]